MSDRTYDTLIVDTPAPSIVRVTLNRPDSLNALNTRMGEELATLFEAAGAFVGDDVRAIVLTAAGERAFCAGADLKERLGMTDEAWHAQHLVFERAIDAIGACPIPLVAAVNGAALGGGCELVLACDLAVASATAKFGQPEALRGIMPGLGGTQRLPRRVGPSRAKDLLLTGRLIEAGEALAWGLVSKVVAPEELATAAVDVARSVATLAPIAARAIKRAVDEGSAMDIESALGLEREIYVSVAESDDRREGIRAFVEKRPPVFQNR